MPERRKTQRYSMRLRVYIIDDGVEGITENISRDGCYIKADVSVTPGIVKDILLELPIIGVISLKGYIQHIRDSDGGMGIQLVKPRFSKEHDIYYNLFSEFIKCLERMAQLHDQYLNAALHKRVRLLTFPSQGEIVHDASCVRN